MSDELWGYVPYKDIPLWSNRGWWISRCVIKVADGVPINGHSFCIFAGPLMKDARRRLHSCSRQRSLLMLPRHVGEYAPAQVQTFNPSTVAHHAVVCFPLLPQKCGSSRKLEFFLQMQSCPTHTSVLCCDGDQSTAVASAFLELQSPSTDRVVFSDGSRQQCSGPEY